MKKSVLLLLLFCVFMSAKAEADLLKSKTSYFTCLFTQTNFSLSLTGNAETSYTLTNLNFAAHYWSNPYSQAQWQYGIVIGHIPCTPSNYVYGRKMQSDGRVMEGGITTTGDVVIKWISGPPMPSSPSGGAYVVDLGNVTISSTGG